MRIGILINQLLFVRDTAEWCARDLCAALREVGHQAEVISMPFKCFPPDRIAPQMLAARLLDVTESSGMPIDRVIGLEFPAYLMEHTCKMLWIMRQHRAAYDLWEHGLGDLRGQPSGEAAMRAIQEADNRHIPRAQRVFTSSRRVSERLRRYNGVASEPLYHPPRLAERYNGAEADSFLLMPYRLSETKRLGLMIEALYHARSDLRVCIVGRPEATGVIERLHAQAAGLPSGRVTFADGVSDEEKLRLYASCLGVVSVPVDEDYAYVTLRAMLAGKPVVTCTDSGGSLEFTVHGETGLIVEPGPAPLADAMDRLWCDRAFAQRLGAQGRDRYRQLGISWRQVVEALTA